MPDKAAMFRSFETQGIDAVRAKLDQGGYNPQWKSAATEWIGKKGITVQRRAEVAQAEQTEIARSSKDAAWASAKAAKRANLIASLALGVAAIALALSVWALVPH